MKKKLLKNQKNEIIMYQHDSVVQLEVLLENETVWLSQAQMVMLFNSSKANISEHIKNIYDTQELNKISTVRKFRTVQKEGNREVMRSIDYFNLDMIIALGYRVNSKRGTEFRIWATKIIKEYLLKGYAINQRFEQVDKKLFQHEQQLFEHQKQIDFFIRTNLPPIEGIFYNGQIFDAYTLVADLIKMANKEIILIDNDVYHIGASFKDLGKKLFAFSKMEMTAKQFLKNI
jgi:hypothetical protein